MKIQNPLIGASKGTLGNTVALRRYGANILRAKPLEVRDAQSATQLAQRQKFSLIQAFLANCLAIVRLAYYGYTSERSAYASAMADNIATGTHGTYPNQTLNPATLNVGKGDLQDLDGLTASREDLSTVLLEWGDTVSLPNAAAGDHVHVVLVDETTGYIRPMVNAALRSTTTLTITLSAEEQALTEPYVLVCVTSVSPKDGADNANKVKRLGVFMP